MCVSNIHTHYFATTRLCAGFLLNSCSISDRKDLQARQNDALRTCYNVRRRDEISVAKLHKEAKLVSLDQRRIKSTFIFDV